jgi:hypothetical protein
LPLRNRDRLGVTGSSNNVSPPQKERRPGASMTSGLPLRLARGFCAWGLGAAALALSLAGCASQNGPNMAAGLAGPGTPGLMQAQLRGPTVAFESIDGPPVAVFQQLVAKLAAEAEQRRVLVVSREGQAAYRIRGYVAALMTRGRTHIGWVWDVYDAQKHRALRIAGEEQVPGKSADAWALLDDAMLSRIARQSMEELVAFLAAPPPAPEPVVADAAPRATPAAFAATFLEQ